MNKIEFDLELPDDVETDQLLRYMSPLEAAFDHSANDLPKEYFDFADKIPPGSKIRVRFEIIQS